MKIFKPLMAFLFLVAFAFPVSAADEKETKAVAMTNKAIEHYKKVGKEKAMADFSNKDNKEFVDGEFYVILCTMEGIFKAHPINPKLIDNPTIWDLKDVNGIFIIRDMVDVAKKSPGGGWSNYVWTHPETKKLAPKKTYVKVHDNTLFMVGYYDIK